MEHNSRNRGKIKHYQRVNAEIEEVTTYYFNGHWATVFTRPFMNAVRLLSQRQRQVFDMLIDRVGTNNLVHVDHAEIAATLHISRNSVSKAISGLCHRGIIYKHHNYVYEIDPAILWFGARKDYFEPPSNPTPRTHQAVEVYDHGKKVTTLHFPRIHNYEQYQRRYGRFQRKSGIGDQ